jgi:hypothetical protein
VSNKLFYAHHARNWRDRSKKRCVCGSHSARDLKKNLHHHSTFARYSARMNRRFKARMVDEYIQYMDWISERYLFG